MLCSLDPPQEHKHYETTKSSRGRTPSDWLFSREFATNYSSFKVLIEEDSNRILGAHLLGPHAEEVINVFATVIKAGFSTDDIKKTIYAYPTGASDISNMM